MKTDKEKLELSRELIKSTIARLDIKLRKLALEMGKLESHLSLDIKNGSMPELELIAVHIALHEMKYERHTRMMNYDTAGNRKKAALLMQTHAKARKAKKSD